MGAGRLRIIRQLLAEAAAIALAGTALGMLIAWKGLALIVSWLPTNSFAAESVIAMNVPVLLASAALAVVTVIVTGMWPALQLSRPDLPRVTQARPVGGDGLVQVLVGLRRGHLRERHLLVHLGDLLLGFELTDRDELLLFARPCLDRERPRVRGLRRGRLQRRLR